jgi:hypothetical protein
VAQRIQRDPIAVLTGGLAGLQGVPFSPMPPTESDVAAQRRAVVPAMASGAPARIITLPTYRPTMQATLPTSLLMRPETVGRGAFRPVQPGGQFPPMGVPQTIEDFERQINQLLPPTPTEGRGLPQEPSTGDIFEPPVPTPPGQLPPSPPPPLFDLAPPPPSPPPPSLPPLQPGPDPDTLRDILEALEGTPTAGPQGETGPQTGPQTSGPSITPQFDVGFGYEDEFYVV